SKIIAESTVGGKSKGVSTFDITLSQNTTVNDSHKYGHIPFSLTIIILRLNLINREGVPSQ
ncbi:MAG: hypothetical protein DRH33_07200, partial [Candidatus Nealsonbacteria bacterium]